MPDPTYDALLLVSFGGPEGPDDVLPFLENVTRGRGVPRERLVDVGRHYHELVGGVSPINGQNRRLRAAIEAELRERGPALPVYWGNRNWTPYLREALAAMRADGVRRALAFFTSAYSSYSGCRQYLDDLDRARADVGAGAPVVDKLRHYYNHPGFVLPMADATRAALGRLARADGPVHLVFTAHSIPVRMAAASGPTGNAYVTQLRETAHLVAAEVGGNHPWELVFQSRSGPPQVPWLEPDVNDHLRVLAGLGAAAAVLVPIGFVSDHMEVVYDLDTEAQATAAELGLTVARAATAASDPRFVAMVRDLVVERVEGPAAVKATCGSLGPSHDVCPVDCCRAA